MAEFQAAEPAAKADLNLVDIDDVIRVFDYCAAQGAYRGWDVVRQVLALRTKLQAFLAAAGYQPPPSAPAYPEAAEIVAEGVA